jgi:hypothetical protein
MGYAIEKGEVRDKKMWENFCFASISLRAANVNILVERGDLPIDRSVSDFYGEVDPGREIDESAKEAASAIMSRVGVPDRWGIVARDEKGVVLVEDLKVYLAALPGEGRSFLVAYDARSDLFLNQSGCVIHGVAEWLREVPSAF